ncbi:MAG: hypothetical protein ACLFV7_08355 [Phycisphaerae bacterium]
MNTQKRNRKWGILALLLTFSQAGALIVHPQDDPPSGLTAPSPAVVGSWGGYATAVAIAPNFAISTLHQGGGVGETVTFDGNDYLVAEEFPHSTADFRVVRLTRPDATPAEMSEFVQLYTGTDEVGQTAVLGGFGESRGAQLTSGGITYGYQWGTAGGLRWGRNAIDANDLVTGTEVLVADFDGPGQPSYLQYEATIADGDSGAGWFLFDGNWKLAAITNNVDIPGEAIFLDADTLEPDPEHLEGIRVSPYAEFIHARIPEPLSLTILLGGAGLIAVRRRR